MQKYFEEISQKHFLFFEFLLWGDEICRLFCMQFLPSHVVQFRELFILLMIKFAKIYWKKIFTLCHYFKLALTHKHSVCTFQVLKNRLQHLILIFHFKKITLQVLLAKLRKNSNREKTVKNLFQDILHKMSAKKNFDRTLDFMYMSRWK